MREAALAGALVSIVFVVLGEKFRFPYLSVLVLICLLPLFVMVVLGVCNRWLGPWACHSYGWHFEPRDISYRGINAHGVCPRCGKQVIRDSQGDWF